MFEGLRTVIYGVAERNGEEMVFRLIPAGFSGGAQTCPSKSPAVRRAFRYIRFLGAAFAMPQRSLSNPIAIDNGEPPL